MIDKLTKEQESRFPEFVDKWTKIGLSTESADRKREALYAHFNKDGRGDANDQL